MTHDELPGGERNGAANPPRARGNVSCRPSTAIPPPSSTEEKGLIRWLRPECQNPGGGAAQLGIEVDETAKPVPQSELRPWPTRLPDQFGAVHAVLEALGEPADAETVARGFTGRLSAKRRQSIAEVLETLANVGRVRRVGEGEFVAR